MTALPQTRTSYRKATRNRASWMQRRSPPAHFIKLVFTPTPPRRRRTRGGTGAPSSARVSFTIHGVRIGDARAKRTEVTGPDSTLLPDVEGGLADAEGKGVYDVWEYSAFRGRRA